MAPLSDTGKRTLLKIARDSIACAFGGRKPAAPPDQTGLDPELLASAGAFVCLHGGENLRGCIGTFEGREPLHRTIAEMAHSAAFHDPRFPPLSERELQDLDVEISVLTPMRRIRDPEEVQVGRHGVYVVQGPCRGVLLPQVATEHGWDRETFLAQTCRKACLPPDAWKKGAELYVFEAEVFGEKD